MINHIDLGRDPEERRKVIGPLIRKGDITLGGYKKARIYGLLACTSGKRMKVENRVFFKDEAEALANGYRPCGHCMKKEHGEWKSGKIVTNKTNRASETGRIETMSDGTFAAMKFHLVIINSILK